MAPSFDIVRVNPHGDAVLAGRAAPGSRIVVASNGKTIASADADADGQWVAIPAQRLPPGGQELTLTSQSAGGFSIQAVAPLIVVVPDAPPAPALTAAMTATPQTATPQTATPQTATPQSAAPQPAAPVFALVAPPGDMPRLLQAPAPAQGSKPAGKLSLDIVDYDEHGAIRFAGAAPPRTAVRLYIDEQPAGDTVADASGHWTLLPSATVAAGDHRLRVDQLAAGGQASARIEVPFKREVVQADEALAGRVVVQPRQNLWRIARHAYGRGVRYTVIYQANRDQIRDPRLIYPGQIFSIPAATAD